MIRSAEQFVPIKLNAEKDGKAVADKYGVHSYPMILFINASGQVEGKIGGYMPPAPFAQSLNKIAAAHRDLPALEARSKANPRDARTAARLAVVYAGQGKTADASRLLARAEAADPKNGTGALPEAYNAVADMYQENRQFAQAIPLFRKAAKTGKKPYDIAYAHISIAVCYLSQNNTQAAIPELKATMAVPGAPPDMKDQAKQILAQVQSRIGK